MSRNTGNSTPKQPFIAAKFGAGSFRPMNKTTWMCRLLGHKTRALETPLIALTFCLRPRCEFRRATEK